MSGYISHEVRHIVAERAQRRCEYCLIHEGDMYFGGEVDHIISLKHGGASSYDNLAFACLLCNRAKGSDIATLVGGELVRLYNPRLDRWSDHFEIPNLQFKPVTQIGEATVRLLRLNDQARLNERKVLAAIGRFP